MSDTTVGFQRAACIKSGELLYAEKSNLTREEADEVDRGNYERSRG
jgi:hypothetical protein